MRAWNKIRRREHMEDGRDGDYFAKIDRIIMCRGGGSRAQGLVRAGVVPTTPRSLERVRREMSHLYQKFVSNWALCSAKPEGLNASFLGPTSDGGNCLFSALFRGATWGVYSNRRSHVVNQAAFFLGL